MTGPTLVTGATGFIGSAVVRRLLARGRAVRAFVEPGAPTANLDGLDVELVTGDVLDRASVGRAMTGCDAVYHLAAIYSLWLPDDKIIYDVNVEGTKNILFAAMKSGVRRVVHTSSIAAIGVPPEGTLADETFAFNYWHDANAYIRSKYLSDLDAQRFAREGVPVVIVCPAFPFGERDLAPTPTGRFIVEALHGRVPGYTAGGFCAVDVDDVAECHVLADERGVIGERYIAGAHNVTYKDFYDQVTEIAGLKRIKRKLPTRAVLAMAWMMERRAERTGKAPRVTVRAARYACETAWFDTSKARALGMPQTPLAQTIDKAVRWFRDHGY
ncbi:MAG TPA: SDR family oxidoreductase [Kofleriaceae bacterium]|nr:SDR family oxidoreductase [Kofleriaceae bacterium]